MKQLFITEVEQSLLSILDNAQMKALHEALTHALWGKDVVAIDNAEPLPEAQSNQNFVYKNRCRQAENCGRWPGLML